MWSADPGILELIAYLDQIPEEKRAFPYLKKNEIEIIVGEVRRCQESFEYAARNYFWITDKLGNDIRFALWESQMLVLEKFYELRSRYVDQGLNRAVKVMILKARQLGMSTLIEAMLAWQLMFFSNSNCLVVSDNSTKAEALFGIMSHIYDRMPWWLKPMQDKFSYKMGMHLQNPDPDARREEPGLNSRLWVAAATQKGVGQGFRLSGVHASEYASYEQVRAKEIIEGDLLNAIAETPFSFAFLESTAKGAGTYAHRLWKANVEMAERARWIPVFLPAFMERTRVLPPPRGWQAQKPELNIAKRVLREWVQCDNPSCARYTEQFFRGENRVGTTCRDCRQGTMRPVILSSAQLFWMQDRRENAEHAGPDAVKEHRQEMCTTAEEAWQISGIEVFPYVCQTWVDVCVSPPLKVGFLDSAGKFHGPRGADGRGCWMEGCEIDHSVDECPLEIWEDPIPGENYVVGVDVAEGLGGAADYTVAWLNRIGRGANPDCQVAMWRSNTVDPITAATPIAQLGLLYNEALMSIEINKYDTLANTVRFGYQYPNLYRWKHLDSTNVLSTKWHWVTQVNTRPRLHQHLVRWLKSELLVVRTSVFKHEMLTFQKEDYEERGAGAAAGFWDDTGMACAIALYTSHEMDWNENLGYIPLPNQIRPPQECRYTMTCLRCGKTWGEDDPARPHHTDANGNGCCPGCGSISYSGKPNSKEGLKSGLSWEALLEKDLPLETDVEMEYDRL